MAFSKSLHFPYPATNPLSLSVCLPGSLYNSPLTRMTQTSGMATEVHKQTYVHTETHTYPPINTHIFIDTSYILPYEHSPYRYTHVCMHAGMHTGAHKYRHTHNRDRQRERQTDRSRLSSGMISSKHTWLYTSPFLPAPPQSWGQGRTGPRAPGWKT